MYIFRTEHITLYSIDSFRRVFTLSIGVLLNVYLKDRTLYSIDSFKQVFTLSIGVLLNVYL